MPVPYTFGTATSSIPLSQLDSNFATAITIGNTAVQLGNTVTTLNNLTLANVTISSGNVTVTNVAVTTANVSGTANVSTMVIIGNESVGGNTTVTGNITASINVTGAKLIPTGTSVTGNGLYLPAANALGLSTNGTEAMRVDASQNVLVGTTSNSGVDTGSQRLVVNGLASGGGAAICAIADSVGRGIRVTDSGKTNTAVYDMSSTIATLGTNQSIPLTFITVGSERMRIDSSGNVGIGTSSPASKLNVASGMVRVDTGYGMEFGGATNFIIGNSPANTLRFYTNNAEAARIDASANLLVGTTSSGGVGFTVGADAAGRILTSNVSAVPFDVYFFKNNGTTVGKITINTSSTSYTTTSDYRLKEDVQPMTGALAKVQALKPVTYKWNADNSNGEGFIAHELAEVCPHAVTGEKDAVNEDGSIKPQGIDTSFLVATLTAAIQELKALVDTQASTITQLQADVATLKGKK